MEEWKYEPGKSLSNQKVCMITMNGLVSRGANIIIDARRHSAGHAQVLVDFAAKSGGHVTIRNSTRYSVADLEILIAKGNDYVTLDFCTYGLSHSAYDDTPLPGMAAKLSN
jgi:hypothetical protein